MKLVSFSINDGLIRPGALLEDGNLVLDLGSAYNDTLEVISGGVTAPPAGVAYPSYPLAEVRIHAPLSNPPRIFCIGANYREHAKETGHAVSEVPVVFLKMTTAIIGPGQPIVLPVNSAEPDYEAELAFVIGHGGYRIAAEEWRRHVYGYTIVNDVSARDVQRATSQWSLAKSFPTFCPMGPAVVTADEISDPHSLDIRLTIDGEILQNSSTNQFVFQIPRLVEYISSITPLLPGDIVSTGTPAGVGTGRTPKRWLKPGESVTISIEHVGTITNPVVAE
jgi:2-keto-4-pentenoate hydratase/2-oxohepta-3-ene-1,7-dioic acid hydratase in catechol pathway